MSQPINAQIASDFYPEIVLLQMKYGSWIFQSIYAAAKLGIADLLKDGSRSCEDLASVTSTHEGSLYRLLRGLASMGVFAETEPSFFTLTPLGNYLRGDVPGSLKARVIMNGEEQYRAWGEIIYSIQTGKSAFERLYGMNLLDYYAKNPEAGKNFNQAMTSSSTLQNPGIVLDYDFSDVQTLVDVGGGQGKLLTDILKAYPKMKGILFDQPEAIKGAKSLIEQAEILDRCQLIAGNFFESVPAGGDAYILKYVIHDWDDERAIAILKSCYEAMPEHGKLLLVEQVIPSGNQASFSKMLDLQMLVLCPGGRERTQAEYRILMEKSKFQLIKIVPTQSSLSVIEAVKV
ncbi:MAG: methyltransferase [Nostoc sp. ZfuVER08]|uniref:Methyltransferase n=1 Tax=Nostoc punctiforme FACHB-252 TaxID=1357509 RepID=A0ABR8HAP1_NOSPU|nr:methyltransferase [Nostoc punctiforme]MBD2612488.1 methyltransferase [Nostoc punctiforme FACHB-252]MBL1200694.1 methyltransferase [Nostoc sp. GBBB01]MDZ8014216.1 methyltransferase [Nostoc sp. ZfuVER08]